MLNTNRSQKFVVLIREFKLSNFHRYEMYYNISKIDSKDTNVEI
jgi:hypothetical protein